MDERYLAELRTEEIEAALRDLLGYFYEYRTFLMLRTSSGAEMALPNDIAEKIRTAYTALGETLPRGPFRPRHSDGGERKRALKVQRLAWQEEGVLANANQGGRGCGPYAPGTRAGNAWDIGWCRAERRRGINE